LILAFLAYASWLKFLQIYKKENEEIMREEQKKSQATG
jgi:hypothetical protein